MTAEEKVEALREWARRQVAWADHEAAEGSADFITITTTRRLAGDILVILGDAPPDGYAPRGAPR